MKLLLDTHTLLWWLTDDPKLSRRANDAIARQATEVFVSAASAVEIATKHRIGKLPHVAELVDNFSERLNLEDFRSLAITLEHGLLSGRLEIASRDPFDRLLIAQSIVENMILVSNEAVFESYGAQLLW